MKLIDGREIAKSIISELKSEVQKLSFRPLFCDVLVGNDPVSLSYVKIKGRTAEAAGLSFLLKQLPGNISQEDLIKQIQELNVMENMCGLIVQLPLPSHIDRQVILNAIDSRLD